MNGARSKGRVLGKSICWQSVKTMTSRLAALVAGTRCKHSFLSVSRCAQ
jgi:hypothetical protein